jgi:hypothetical protein
MEWQDRQSTHSDLPSSKSIVSLLSFHVESMFSTWRMSDWLPLINWSITFAGIFIFSLHEESISSNRSLNASTETHLNAMLRIRERTVFTSGLVHDVNSNNRQHAPSRENDHIPTIREAERRRRQRLQLLGPAIIRDAYNRDLAKNPNKHLFKFHPIATAIHPSFLDQRVQCANTTAVATGHAVNLVHDKARLVSYRHARRVGRLYVQIRTH